MQYDNEQLDRLEPGYLARYGLSASPFSPAYNERMVYLDAERTQRLDMLQHLTQFSDLLLMITGEHGAGKTTLMRRFVANADEGWRICQVDASPMMHADQLLRHVAAGFGLQPLPDDPASLQQALYQQLVSFQHRAQVPILIVDDAHDLPEDALEALFTLADTRGGEGNLLRTILFCEPQIETTLQSPAIQPLRQRITHTLNVPPLNEEQVAEYLRHRMSTCGAQDDNPFTPKVIRRIHRASQGLPGRINPLAHGVLRDGRIDEPEKSPTPRGKSRRINSQHAFLVLTVVLLAGIGFSYQDEINSLFDEKQTNDNASVQNSIPAGTLPSSDGSRLDDLKPAKTTPPTPVAKTTPAAEQVIEFQVGATNEDEKGEAISVVDAGPGDTTQPPTQSPAKSESPAEANPNNATSHSRAANDESTTSANIVAEKSITDETKPSATTPPTATPSPAVRIDSMTPTRVVGSTRQQVLKLRGEGFTDSVAVSIKWDGGEKLLPASRISVISNNALTFAVTTGTKTGTWRVAVSNPSNNSSDTFAFRVQTPLARLPEKPTRAELRDNAWWQTQNPKFFSIQLLNASQEKTAQAFLQKYTFNYDAGYVTVSKDGARLYTVLLGVFPSRGNAQTALQTLPAEVRELKPWVRPLSGVQEKLAPQTATSGNLESNIKSSTSPIATAAATPMPLDPAAHNGWLWSRNPKQFTLQLLGSHEEARLKQFVHNHQLQGKVVWFKTQQKNRDWYALIYGDFPTREAALQARSGLSAELRKASPWIRSFASIHSEIEAP